MKKLFFQMFVVATTLFFVSGCNFTISNHVLVAIDQNVTTQTDTPVDINLTSSDNDGENINLDYEISSAPTHGTLSGTAPNVTYTPAAGYVGSDSFLFTVYDCADVSQPGTVNITVAESNTTTNHPPVANNDTVTVAEDAATTSIDVLANDTDADGDTLQIKAGSVTAPNHGGTAVINGNKIDFTPAANFNGTETFSYTVNDGTVDGNSATVSVTVTAVNDTPVADDQNVTTNENTNVSITLTGSDIDGDSLNFTVTMNPAHGTLSGVAPNLIYTPDSSFTGDDNFKFVANDGTLDSPEANVVISVGIVHNGVKYGTVVSPSSGRVWLDRNLGASRVCETIDDTSCYGNYYQWGRSEDGHENNETNVSATLATGIYPVTPANIRDKFIRNSSSPFDWVESGVDDNGSVRMANWSKIDGSSICPVGFRVPTSAEWETETTGIGIGNNSEAFNSFLKIPTSGFRHALTGVMDGVGQRSDFWTSTPNGTASTQIYINNSSLIINDPYRAYGHTIRCIKGPLMIINDNFDTDAVGTLPAGWTIKYGGTSNANQKVVDTVYVSSGHSFQLEGAGGWAANIYKTPDFIPNSVTVESNIYIDQVVSNDSGWIALRNDSVGSWGTQVGGLRFRNGKFYAFYTGGNMYEISNFTPRQWYHVKMVYDIAAKTYQIYIDGALVSGTYGGTSYDTFPMHPSVAPAQLMLTAGNGATVKVFYDDVKMYQSILPAP